MLGRLMNEALGAVAPPIPGGHLALLAKADLTIVNLD